MEIQVVAVERGRGRAERVEMQWGAFSVSFAALNGRAVVVSRIRADGARLHEREALQVPNAVYAKMLKTACAILRGSATRTRKRRSFAGSSFFNNQV